MPELNAPEDDKSVFGLFSVRSLWRQSGVRVSPAGHVKRGVRPPKSFTTSIRHLPPRSLFHHPGWRQPPAMIVKGIVRWVKHLTPTRPALNFLLRGNRNGFCRVRHDAIIGFPGKPDGRFPAMST